MAVRVDIEVKGTFNINMESLDKESQHSQTLDVILLLSTSCVFNVLQSGLAKSRYSSPLTEKELAAEVPETLTQMVPFFFLALLLPFVLTSKSKLSWGIEYHPLQRL